MKNRIVLSIFLTYKVTSELKVTRLKVIQLTDFISGWLMFRDQLTDSKNFEYRDLSLDKYKSELRGKSAIYLPQGLRNRDFCTNRPRLLKFGLVE